MRHSAFALFAALVSTPVGAHQVIVEGDRPLEVTEGATSMTVPGAEGDITIERHYTNCALAVGAVQPMVPVEGVTPVGEIEVLEALKDPETLLIDMRETDWFVDATIPTAINIPHSEVADRLDELGCEETLGQPRWDCSNARRLIAFCNGPACGQSPRAIRAMSAEGFPMENVFYYRGGMQSWQVLGFSTVGGEAW